ncbi:hypothetical protein JCM4814A_09180 [Streptomyces phaeofaciens JCM 4814]|uniref:Integrase n=1 Tax=Streptomyces phaeofaciens TaxID=68254 RepID=A0A918M128_9ACTN|nr:hypothetical protein GCM10010226_81510 [Streptomyces phaeofaciens]
MLPTKNVARWVKVQRARGTRPDPRSVDEACTYLENARIWRDYLYPAHVPILVLGLRKGEVLGLTWSDVNLDTGEPHIRHQLQRVRRRPLHTDTAKTEASEAVCRCRTSV